MSFDLFANDENSIPAPNDRCDDKTTCYIKLILEISKKKKKKKKNNMYTDAIPTFCLMVSNLYLMVVNEVKL